MSGVQVTAEFLECGHVEFLDVGVMWNPPLGFLHALRDPTPQADDLYLLDPLPRGEPGPGSDARAATRGNVGVDVGMTDAATGSGPRDELQRDAELVGAAAHCGGGQRLRPRWMGPKGRLGMGSLPRGWCGCLHGFHRRRRRGSWNCGRRSRRNGSAP